MKYKNMHLERNPALPHHRAMVRASAAQDTKGSPALIPTSELQRLVAGMVD
ncbi:MULTISPECIES: hypothetical protein [Novosphingobium]|uniref:Uncharacterized protein n=2 Tax=Novosphingobium TaxID=165696 RepID=A0ABT0A7B6_9SPHN|nr:MULTISPECIES: hypothetical protein [Novosphingobium]MCJ1959090.1 hypothetical protein [Novosphingobium mangrovi (ex Hu et al. 2023)]